MSFSIIELYRNEQNQLVSKVIKEDYATLESVVTFLSDAVDTDDDNTYIAIDNETREIVEDNALFMIELSSADLQSINVKNSAERL